MARVRPSSADLPEGEKAAKQKKNRRMRRGPAVILALSLVGISAAYALSLYYLRPASPGRSLRIGEVLQAAEQRRVFTAELLDQDARIVGTVGTTDAARPQRFHAAYPQSDTATNDLLRTLIESGAEVGVDPQSAKSLVRFIAQFLLPLLILANIFALLFFANKGGGGGTSEILRFGRMGDRRSRAKSSTTFADVAACDEAVVELTEIRDYLANPAAFKAVGAVPPKGVLLVGPPGCGKTLLARAVAGEAQASFFAISGSEFVESLVGVGAARVRDLFRQARASAPSILFIDELDAAGRQRGAGVGGGHDEREQTLNELLVQMDGFSPTEGVVVMAATNRPDILDAALLRPGRFDRRITVERPDADGRLRILRLHASTKRFAAAEIDLPIVALSTPGFTGADLAAMLNEAALLAVRERAGAISGVHLDEAVERVVAGPRRRAQVMSPSDKRRVATHEAGHATVAAALGRVGSLDKLSIISRGGGIGHLALLADDAMLPTSEDMEHQIAIAMAGIAAEMLVLGRPSVGAESDLERATAQARDMAGRFGMSERLGRARLLREAREVFLGRDYLLSRDVSQPTLEHLDNEVRRILDEQEAVARSLLVSNRRVLDSLTEALMLEETLKGQELRRYLQAVVPSPPGALSENGTSRPRARRTTKNA